MARAKRVKNKRGTVGNKQQENVFYSCCLAVLKTVRRFLSYLIMATKARRLNSAQRYSGIKSGEVKESEIAMGDKLLEFLERKVLSGQLTAVDMCVVAHYVTGSGGKGLEDFDMDPATAEKHASEHCELILGKKFKKTNLRNLEVPAYTKKGCMRTKMNIAVRLPSVILAEKYDDLNHVEPAGADPSILSIYGSHPVVKKGLETGIHWSRILALALYWDGVKYTSRDSFVGIFMTDYRTMEPALLALWRKSDVCNCGCRGWCTIFPILLEIALDIKESELVGFLMACFMTKGDWPAYTEFAAVRQWYLFRNGKMIFV